MLTGLRNQLCLCASNKLGGVSMCDYLACVEKKIFASQALQIDNGSRTKALIRLLVRAFWSVVLRSLEEDQDFVGNVVFSDESTFRGQLSTHNCRFWGTENPRKLWGYVRDSTQI